MACPKRVASLTALAVIATSFMGLARSAEPDPIKPDQVTQEQLKGLFRLIDQTKSGDEQASLQFDRAIAKLRATYGRKPEDLIRQLLWYDAHTAKEADMTTTVVLGYVPGVRGHIVDAVAPLVDEKYGQRYSIALAEMLRLVEYRPEESWEEPFSTYYSSYIEGKVEEKRNLDNGMMVYLFIHAPSHTFGSLVHSFYRGDERAKPLLQARYAVDDLVRRRSDGLVGSGPPDPPDAAVTEQLKKMAARDEWWARAYAAAIIREHAELGTPELVNDLKQDNNEVVQALINPKPDKP